MQAFPAELPHATPDEASGTHSGSISMLAVGGGTRVEIVENGPSVAARFVAMMSRVTIKPILSVGSHLPHLPWPFGLVESACAVVVRAPGVVRETIALPNASARLVRAGKAPGTAGRGRVVLYLHGGAFVVGGANSHSGIATAISRFAESPVLVVNYRLIPKHSIEMALDDCHDAYLWLRERGHRPDEIVVAGDSAGGYLALALALRLREKGEAPAALVAMSPLLQLNNSPKRTHFNVGRDAMFPPKAWDALVALAARASAARSPEGDAEELYEPLEHIEPGLPPTLIHVSASEVLLHDARLAADRLAAAGVSAEVRIWPGQAHIFQIAAPIVPEAKRSLRQIGEYIRRATIDSAESGVTASRAC